MKGMNEYFINIRQQAELQAYKEFPWIKEEGHKDGYHELCFCNYVETFIKGAEFVININKQNEKILNGQPKSKRK